MTATAVLFSWVVLVDLELEITLSGVDVDLHEETILTLLVRTESCHVLKGSCVRESCV